MTDLQDPTGDVTAAANPLLGRMFTATAVTEHGRARPLVAGTSIQVAFHDSRITVDGGANPMWFPAGVEATRLHTGRGVISQDETDAEHKAQDDMLWAFFTDDPEWELCPPGLVLRGNGTTIELVENPAPGLWGTTFEAVDISETGIVPAPVVEGTTITLMFAEPDGLSAEAGCNTLGFRVTDAGDHLEVDDEVSSTRIACSPELEAQDQWLIALLTADPGYVLSAGELTLTRGSTTVVLQARTTRPS